MGTKFPRRMSPASVCEHSGVRVPLVLQCLRWSLSTFHHHHYLDSERPSVRLYICFNFGPIFHISYSFYEENNYLSIFIPSVRMFPEHTDDCRYLNCHPA